MTPIVSTVCLSTELVIIGPSFVIIGLSTLFATAADDELVAEPPPPAADDEPAAEDPLPAAVDEELAVAAADPLPAAADEELAEAAAAPPAAEA